MNDEEGGRRSICSPTKPAAHALPPDIDVFIRAGRPGLILVDAKKSNEWDNISHFYLAMAVETKKRNLMNWWWRLIFIPAYVFGAYASSSPTVRLPLDLNKYYHSSRSEAFVLTTATTWKIKNKAFVKGQKCVRPGRCSLTRPQIIIVGRRRRCYEGKTNLLFLRCRRPEAVLSFHYDLIKQLKIIMLSPALSLRAGNYCLPFQFVLRFCSIIAPNRTHFAAS